MYQQQNEQLYPAQEHLLLQFSVFNCHLHPSIDRSLASWHYPNSPKNGKPALSPRHDWLNTGSLLQNVPLRIWFYPQ
ncbi:TPA: serine/threonine protein kinase [Escherichia coli]|nr:serine/threonine protein kinase [Escherichia coli]